MLREDGGGHCQSWSGRESYFENLEELLEVALALPMRILLEDARSNPNRERKIVGRK